MLELERLDATGQAQLVRDGEVSPQELVASAAERIATLNGELNAVITDLTEKALATAAGTLPDGPFRGVPMLKCVMALPGRLFAETGSPSPSTTSSSARRASATA